MSPVVLVVVVVVVLFKLIPGSGLFCCARRLKSTTRTAIRPTKTITNTTMPAIKPPSSNGTTATEVAVSDAIAMALTDTDDGRSLIADEIDDAAVDVDVDIDDGTDADADVDIEIVVVVAIAVGLGVAPLGEIVVVAFRLVEAVEVALVVDVVVVSLVVVVVVFGVAIPHTRQRTPRHGLELLTGLHWRSCARLSHPLAKSFLTVSSQYSAEHRSPSEQSLLSGKLFGSPPRQKAELERETSTVSLSLSTMTQAEPRLIHLVPSQVELHWRLTASMVGASSGVTSEYPAPNIRHCAIELSKSAS